MRLHFLGICGTFMGSLALLAREMGHEVSGCDQNIYPPMSTQLEEQGVQVFQGYGIEHFERFGAAGPDLVIVGNAMSRGNEAVEYVLDKQLNYCSGPQWLSDHLLNKKWVLAVAGTHGKTTTTSMLAWILDSAGYKPGFLIGGVPANFDCSARLGESDFFVIEADEYDTAFFDKRSKFVHYHPRTLILNNLEYDHADIFPDIAAIQKQFHHLMRIVPSSGLVIYPEEEHYLQEVIEQGAWSDLAVLKTNSRDEASNSEAWCVTKLNPEGSKFELSNGLRKESAQVSWNLIGDHNIQNAFAASVAAFHVGVPLAESAKALSDFVNVKRRLELVAQKVNEQSAGVFVYDDFAHHPTAIASTLQAIRDKVGEDKVIAVLEPRSNTMRMGVHGSKLSESCVAADHAFWFTGDDEQLTAQFSHDNCQAFSAVDSILDELECVARKTDKNLHIVIMSNGGFSALHERLGAALADLP